MKPPHVQTVIDALRRLRNRYTSEAALQSAAVKALGAAGLTIIPEHRLGLNPGEAPCRDRIDLDVTGPDFYSHVGVEVKVKGGALDHLRQLFRYAHYYNDLILLTTQASRPEDQELPVIRKWSETRAHVCNLHVVFVSHV